MIRERRNQLRHPNYTKPELLATAPNQVWSWDITKLRGPAKWMYRPEFPARFGALVVPSFDELFGSQARAATIIDPTGTVVSAVSN